MRSDHNPFIVKNLVKDIIESKEDRDKGRY